MSINLTFNISFDNDFDAQEFEGTLLREKQKLFQLA